jgi:ribosome-binding factor A
MSRTQGKRPSERQRRVAEELRHALVRALGHARFADPQLADKVITVTEVRLSPDLGNATCFVTPLGGETLGETVAALNRASGYLRGLLAGEVRLRHLPRLSFEADRSFDEASHIAEILARPRVRHDIEAAAEDESEAAGAPEAGPEDDGETGPGHGA